MSASVTARLLIVDDEAALMTALCKTLAITRGLEHDEIVRSTLAAATQQHDARAVCMLVPTRTTTRGTTLYFSLPGAG
jgi:hypothetical protein